MAKSPVRHRTLAPFVGITRIRFKGSSNWTSQPSRLPSIFFLGQNKTGLREVNNVNIVGRLCQPRKLSGFTKTPTTAKNR